MPVSIDRSLPTAVTLSPEIDVIIAEHPRAGTVRRLLGSGSLYDKQQGVYVDVVAKTTPHLPLRWLERAIEYRTVNMPWVTVICPEVHDLAIAKLGTGRADKDYPYIDALLSCRPPLLDLDLLDARLVELSGVISVTALKQARSWLERARRRN